ncbi:MULTISPECIES: F0F1 ATP synthase subunit A [Anaerostipes]|uniref:ATP synthase subunit a n=1 Tax=Anaerostipes butyraticus TaxID=645466 RepID=A0A916VFH8_9FIRM|nr:MULTISPECIES: F0F1 ATP synthase subunit A [Anaerostipes]GFO86782.1 ATP synthase subunit a [Anaerostipes butyraticus]HJC83153.1 F0F1 ATP synthase subunit A [Candidatus Anaerostipes avicola]
MGSLANELMEALELKTSFVIPIAGGIPVPESTVITWGIMAIVILLCIIFVRNLKVVPEGPQVYVEALVGFIYGFIGDLLGEKGKRYIPFLGTVLIYLGCANISGFFRVAPPTKDLNVTAGLAIISLFLIVFSGIREKGLKGYLFSYAEPMPMMIPVNLLELITRPLSLCMRLFGNILGGFVLMELITFAAPAIVPLPFSCYFDFFDGLLQAYVFVLLTSLFINESIE